MTTVRARPVSRAGTRRASSACWPRRQNNPYPQPPGDAPPKGNRPADLLIGGRLSEAPASSAAQQHEARQVSRAVYLCSAATCDECPPPTVSSGLPWRWHPRPSCMLRGARHPGGEADRWSRCRGRAAGTPAGTSGCPPGLEDVLRDGRDVGRMPGDPRQSGAREGHQPGIIQQGPGSGRWPAPRASLWSRPGAVQVAGAQEDAAAWSVRVPVPASR